MKKYGFLLFLVLGLMACSEDNNDPAPEQHVTCALTAPAEGATIDIAETMTIKGEATINYGEISSVTLKVGNKVISEVTKVPFTHEYTFEVGQAEGALKIELTIKGDQGAMSTSEINVTLENTEPTPEPEEGEIVDPRDNHVYKVVTIGEQTWMAENLAYLPQVNKPATAVTCTGELYYYVWNYDGEDKVAAKNTTEYKKCGVLYNWYAAMNQQNATGGDPEAIPSGVKGVCPTGWHVPSKAEWKKLEDFVANELPPVIGNKWEDDFGDEHFDSDCKNVWSALAGTEGWTESGNSSTNPDLANGPRNTYKLNITPSGECFHTGTFGTSKVMTYFWTTEVQASGSGNISFSNNTYRPAFSNFGTVPVRGYPVRCIKD